MTRISTIPTIHTKADYVTKFVSFPRLRGKTHLGPDQLILSASSLIFSSAPCDRSKFTQCASTFAHFQTEASCRGLKKPFDKCEQLTFARLPCHSAGSYGREATSAPKSFSQHRAKRSRTIGEAAGLRIYPSGPRNSVVNFSLPSLRGGRVSHSFFRAFPNPCFASGISVGYVTEAKKTWRNFSSPEAFCLAAGRRKRKTFSNSLFLTFHDSRRRFQLRGEVLRRKGCYVYVWPRVHQFPISVSQDVSSISSIQITRL